MDGPSHQMQLNELSASEYETYNYQVERYVLSAKPLPRAKLKWDKQRTLWKVQQELVGKPSPVDLERKRFTVMENPFKCALDDPSHSNFSRYPRLPSASIFVRLAEPKLAHTPPLPPELQRTSVVVASPKALFDRLASQRAAHKMQLPEEMFQKPAPAPAPKGFFDRLASPKKRQTQREARLPTRLVPINQQTIDRLSKPKYHTILKGKGADEKDEVLEDEDGSDVGQDDGLDAPEASAARQTVRQQKVAEKEGEAPANQPGPEIKADEGPAMSAADAAEVTADEPETKTTERPEVKAEEMKTVDGPEVKGDDGLKVTAGADAEVKADDSSEAKVDDASGDDKIEATGNVADLADAVRDENAGHDSENTETSGEAIVGGASAAGDNAEAAAETDGTSEHTGNDTGDIGSAVVEPDAGAKDHDEAGAPPAGENGNVTGAVVEDQ
ncbi:hypothetical protein HK101_006528 [Irineochytrium annulatum]|nr:hypothetical protein HK101_006528 [Irineochytrium annulatum]